MTPNEIAKLSAAERLSLIGELWDSIADSEAPLPQAQRDELLRRLTQFQNEKAHATSWEALKSEVHARKR